MKKGNRKPVFGPTMAISAAILLLFAVLLFFVGIPLLVDFKIREKTQLIPGTETWDKWLNITIPAFFTLYFFNVTNAEAVLNGSSFEMQEVGPYVWQESRVKDIISLDDDEDTVTYTETVHYFFRPDLSVGSDEDTIDTVNVPFISVATLLYAKIPFPTFANYLLSFISEQENIIQKGVKIRDITFDGVSLNPTYRTLSSLGNVKLPSEFGDGDSFAYFNGKNGTPSVQFTVKRGMKTKEDFGKIVTFNKEEKISWWKNQSFPEESEQYCNYINGTDGSIYAPFVTTDTIIRIFAYDICRAIYMTFENKVDFNGIPAYHFAVPPEMLEHPDLNEDNRCFCISPGQNLANNCLRGIIRLFSCKGGAPITVSCPHLIGASEGITDSVLVKNLDTSIYKTELDIEPTSGMLLRIAKRIQINLEYQTLPGMEGFENVSHTFLPIFWAEEKAEVDEAGLAELRNQLVIPLQILTICKWTVTPILAVALLIGICATVGKRKDEHGESYTLAEGKIQNAEAKNA